MKTLLLKKNDVESLLLMRDVIASVEAGYMAYCSGQVIQPDIVSIELPQSNGEMDVKSGYSESTRMISVKCASGFYDNQKNSGLPNSLSTVLLFDGSTGFPLCIMDGSLITGYRTGAAGAISAKLLARKDSKTAAVLGTGEQARMQILALREVLQIARVLIFGRSAAQLAEYKKEMDQVPGISVEICDTAETAVRNADIVITTTPSKTPIVKAEWVRPGTHIIAVGADMEGKQELDAALFAGAKVVVDNRAQCTSRGETQNPLKQGILCQQEILCEIGEILLGLKPGRTDDSEITIFDTTGMAVQDNVTAAAIYGRALERKLGQYYNFSE